MSANVLYKKGKSMTVMLGIAAISMGFAGFTKGQKGVTGEDVMKGSYENPDARIPLSCGRTIHAVYDGGKSLKLTLVDDRSEGGTHGVKLTAIKIAEMRQFIASGEIHVDGKVFVLGETRALCRMLKRIK